MYRKIIIILLIILIISSGIAICTRPAAPRLEDINYETIQAKVTQIDVRTGKSGKYTTTHYYDVHLVCDEKEYIWHTAGNPNLEKGENCEFILYDGKVYRTVYEMQNNLKITGSSAAFKISVPLALISLVGMCNVALLSYLKRKK